LDRVRLTAADLEIATVGSATVDVKDADVGVVVEARNGEGGILLDAPHPAVTRIEIALDDPGSLKRLRVRHLDETGAAEASWVWELGRRRPPERFITYVFRPGIAARTFDVDSYDPTRQSNRIEILLDVRRGNTGRAHIRRVATCSEGRIAPTSVPQTRRAS
jgi:hypothetical protein